MCFKDHLRIWVIGPLVVSKLLLAAFVAARFDARVMVMQRVAEWWGEHGA